MALGNWPDRAGKLRLWPECEPRSNALCPPLQGTHGRSVEDLNKTWPRRTAQRCTRLNASLLIPCRSRFIEEPQMICDYLCSYTLLESLRRHFQALSICLFIFTYASVSSVARGSGQFYIALSVQHQQCCVVIRLLKMVVLCLLKMVAWLDLTREGLRIHGPSYDWLQNRIVRKL